MYLKLYFYFSTNSRSNRATVSLRSSMYRHFTRRRVPVDLPDSPAAKRNRRPPRFACRPQGSHAAASLLLLVTTNLSAGIGKRCPGAATRAGAGAGAACCHTCWCWCSAVLQSHAYKARPNFRLRRRENARLKGPRIEIEGVHVHVSRSARSTTVQHNTNPAQLKQTRQ